MAGKSGGSWKVAYADFVTAMMAFFLVMWLSAQKPEIKEAVADYFQDPFGEADQQTGGGAAPLPNHEGGLPTTFQGERPPKDEPRKGVPRPPRLASQLPRGPRIPMRQPSDLPALGVLVEFADDSTELSENAKRQLRTVLPEILGKPQKIELRGYAARGGSSRSTGFDDHWQLCYARCVAAMNYLTEHGIEPNRIRLSQAGIYRSRPLHGDVEWDRGKSGVEIFLLAEIADPPPGTALGTPLPLDDSSGEPLESDSVHAGRTLLRHAWPAAPSSHP